MRAPRPIPAPVTRPAARGIYRIGVDWTYHHQPFMGETLLHWAAFCGLVGEVQALLPVGADPNATDDGGNTPLHRAADRGITLRDWRRLVVVLLAAGADPNRENKTTLPPLLAAARDRKVAVVRQLVGNVSTRPQ